MNRIINPDVTPPKLVQFHSTPLMPSCEFLMTVPAKYGGSHHTKPVTWDHGRSLAVHINTYKEILAEGLRAEGITSRVCQSPVR